MSVKVASLRKSLVESLNIDIETLKLLTFRFTLKEVTQTIRCNWKRKQRRVSGSIVDQLLP